MKSLEEAAARSEQKTLTRPTRVLHLEDDPNDAELVKLALASGGLSCEMTRVAAERAFRRALAEMDFDLILADYSLPSFNGMAALAIAREIAPHVPFVFLSGTLGEEVAIESLKRGATDYIVKDRLARLGPAVKRALSEAALERERRHAESALRESQNRLSLAVRASGIGIWSWEVNTDRFHWDARMHEILGSADETPSDLTSFISRLHEEDRDRVESQLRSALDGWAEFYLESRIGRPDGTVRHVATRGRFLPDEASGNSRAIAVCWDITDQKRDDERRRLLSTVLESAANAIMITDSDGRISWVNSAFTELTGYTLEEALGQNPRLLKSGKHDENFYRKMWDTISHGSTWHGQVINRRKDGAFYTEEMTISPVRGASGETVSFVCMKRDITFQVDLAHQLHQAQKLEAVGRLAGGVAHDFNNILTVISGNAELALADLPAGDPTAEALKDIVEASRRAASLTRQLLAFSRRQILQPKVLDFNALVSGTEKMLRRLIGEDIKLSTRLQPNLAAITADPGQLEQILMNLAVNARDAMPQGGELVFETENIEMQETQAGQYGVRMPSDRYVRLTVKDTGHGMDEETQARIFEPFFTTKEKSKGTGLGLSTVYGIVKQSGGYIWVRSAPGKGATFKVYLPQVDSAPDRSPKAPTTVAPGGGESILLVEDEETVLKLARSILERAGYTVVTATNGAEALRLVREYPKPIHLLVTDVVMPGMSGPVLADSLQPLRKGLRVLYTSGYTDDAIVHHGVLDSGAHLLEKPYSQNALLSTVRRVLDSAKRQAE
jgi:two-component system cell cycle sensor histidine kinase/response regulator CckA